MRRAAIEEQNRYLVEHQRPFRLAADVVVEAWTAFAEIQAIAVIGSVAQRPDNIAQIQCVAVSGNDRVGMTQTKTPAARPGFPFP